jgi:hypothetical protein
LSPGHYNEFRTMWIAKGPLGEKESAEIDRYLEGKRKITPAGAPVLVLAGSGDYSLAPARRESPSAFLKEWHAAHPGERLRFTTLGKYLDALDRSARHPYLQRRHRPQLRSFLGSARVKGWYRECEHALKRPKWRRPAPVWRKARLPVDALPTRVAAMFEHGPQHVMGRGGQHGVRARPIVGRATVSVGGAASPGGHHGGGAGAADARRRWPGEPAELAAQDRSFCRPGRHCRRT